MGNSNIFSCERKVIDLNSKDMFSIESFTTLQKLSGDKIDPNEGLPLIYSKKEDKIIYYVKCMY